MVSIAILGFGVVGGGVAAVLEQNKDKIKRMCGDEVRVKYILDLRDFPDSPYGDLVVHDITPILEDPEVSIVAETMGGSHPAFEFSVAAMKAGKSVVTSNKEVVANYGVELNAAAKECGVSYLFEAAVGGGIPVIRSIRTSLAGDRISAINGIMNGTTNYIISKMKNEGSDFDAVLKEAQALGYAEKNPSADVDGIDTQRKIIILTALASDLLLAPENVYAETMTRLTGDDMAAAAKWGGTVRLVGSSRITDDGRVVAWVCPTFVPNSHPLAHVEDVYNAISVDSPVTGDVMYYGRGAGRYPTAGAVVSDIVAAASGSAAYEAPAAWQKAGDKSDAFADRSFSYYVRLATDSPSEAIEAARLAFGSVEVLADSPKGTVELITGEIKEKDAREIFEGDSLGTLLSRIRLLA